ncbi:MAG: chromosome segregation protein SMC [Sutterellaceae bacterium]|nr:chromosome segregation protein SMC [Burkholderiaceae bacterium]MCX7901516.1 chromosome segregation protein SMC [Burkholderiaceae bacterium]MDW8430884.1 chromosome segregation protein SMC [Sutterellaceae bacterium]
MRLRQIKLAGFKSFVDPTHIEVPGNLVGVVGPNGCGKSNVIDAVRWVLGESKAAELRGESMQDVIFNGSANRKPAGRASVELVFDNSDGRLGGEWGRFTEISVKRVLTRDGASSYYINNQTVRRRDVQDMFLGTGLGPRAYAIIGQGMITRIIEARPEELRVFLEEAAGVSKYKERRRETENRLADTRDNLTRVEDILRELDNQIAHLERQAEVARRYHELKRRHDETQQLLWLTRKRDAAAEQERLIREIECQQVALEAHMAQLRAAERRVEELRAAHLQAADRAHAVQAETLKVEAEIAKLESEIRMIADARARLRAQVKTLADTRARRLEEMNALQDRAVELQQQQQRLSAELVAASERCAAHEKTLPALEEAYHAAREGLAAARAEAALAEQAIEGLGAQMHALQRQLAALAQRRERFEEERERLGAPNEGQLAELQASAQRLQTEVETLSHQLHAAEATLAQLQQTHKEALRARTRESEALSRLEARAAALREVLSNLEADERLDPWLRKQGLEGLPRLFKRLRVEPGWEVAVEAVLHERLQAVEVSRLDTLAGLASDLPPARVAFFSATGALPNDAAPATGLVPLADRVRGYDVALAAVLRDWLHGTYVADDLVQALARREQLPPGAQFVVPAGHRVSRYGVRFYAPDDRQAGLLARRRELENLEREVKAQKLLLEQATDALMRVEARLRAAQSDVDETRQALERTRSQWHTTQLDAVRMQEMVARVRLRSGQLDAELAEVRSQERELQAQYGELEKRFQEVDANLAARQQAQEHARQAYESADEASRAARQEAQRLAAERQRVEYELAATQQRAIDLEQALSAARAEVQRLARDIETSELEAAKLDDSAARAGLQEWLQRHTQMQERLREARSALDDLAQQVRRADEERLLLEREVLPKRERIADLQLKEQAVRLVFEQYAQLLAQSQADEAALAARLQSDVRAHALQNEINALAEQIATLGAVNLAALDELNAARERKGFLDAQSADLKAAIATLEDAIRRIDRETRQLLQQTFDQVNAHFGELFPRLFGGGEAKLIMTGDEILDAGVQVMAQPPGKRNSTIHLLSGGEKALAATALVFALFKLNPAPFCLLDEVDAPLDDANTERFCDLVRSMSNNTQFLFITHNKIAMEMAEQLIGVTMQEQGVSRIVAVDIGEAQRLAAEAV